jgi:N-acetylglucosaminyldiphosphoundecaprenol N-acetyl-beta-D-mannosaminyltransferase
MAETASAEIRVKRVNVLGVGLSVLNMESAKAAIVGALAAKRKGYICVTGVHGVMEAQQDPAFRSILNRAFLVTPDGMPMVWAGRMAGFRQMDRVYGPDLMLDVLKWSQSSGATHFLYGGADGVAGLLKQKLEARFPGVRIVGTYTPPFRPLTAEESAALAAQVAALKPDFFWVGLSTPKQERFMAANLDRLDATVMLGVGAAFDFHAGLISQAPRWIQRSGFEWLYRMCADPKRLWRRYLRNNPRFLALAFCQATGFRKFPLEETAPAS